MLNLNEEQKKAVYQMNNAVVAAGAGSGKTFVLAQRYAHLVLERGLTVDQILTLTFTNKAASEMYQRIYKTINKIAQDEPNNIRAKQAILNFSEARIQTLDSYCASILKNASRHYGIRPDFTVDDEQCENFGYKLALPFLLDNRKNIAILELVNNYSIEDIAKNLFAQTITKHSNLANPIDFIFLLENQTNIARKKWKETTQDINETIQKIIYILENFDGKSQKIIEQLKIIFNDNDFNVIPEFNSLLEFFKTSNEIAPENIELKTYLEKINLIQKISLQGRTTNESILTIKELIKEIKIKFSKLCSIASFIANYKIPQLIYPLLDEFQNQFNEYKRSSGILSFSDISHLAVEILINYPEIRNVEKSSFKAIMIDEFQDDNQLQKELLFLLAEKLERTEKSVPNPNELYPDKLFFVGDEKQSIYKFRGADVSVFRNLKDELTNSSDLTLSTNYRSHPALIASFNSLFGGYDYPTSIEELEKPTQRNFDKSALFVNEKQLTLEKKFPDFEATYNWVKPSVKDKNGNPINIDLTPRINFLFYNNTQEDNLEETNEENIFEDLKFAEIEAMAISQKIKNFIDTKKYQSKDCAILFRSTSNQHLYEKHLRKLGISYTSESVVGFFNESPINNIYYLLRLLVYPTDMVAYENLLFSPFVNLSQSGVNLCMIYCAKKIKEDKNVISEDLLFSSEIENQLSNKDLENYSNGKKLFLDLSEKIKNISLTEIITELWYNLGNRYETLWCDTVSLYEEMYDYLFEIAHQTEEKGLGLSDLVDKLETLKVNNERLSDMDIPLEKPNAVRLMTIHKSKGLEFPVVFICGCSAKGKSETTQDLVYFDKENGISLNTKCPNWFVQNVQNFFYVNSKDLINLEREAELRRVLYVAMTRAEKELYLSGKFTINKKATENLAEVITNFSSKNFTHEELLEILNVIAINKLSEKSKDTLDSSQLVPNKCVTNNSFMGFLLYIISEWNKNEQGIYPPCPFNLESINLENIEEISVTKRKSINQIIKEIKHEYEKAKIIQTEIIDKEYISPSKLHDKSTSIQNDNLYSNPEIEIDQIIKSFENNEFGHDNFGTIAHAFTESLFTKQNPNIPSILIQMLTEKQKQTVFETAHEMAQRFFDSDLGKLAQQSSWRKNEYNFKLLVKPNSKIGNVEFDKKQIINGQIDLVFKNPQDENQFIIVDFKTDRTENPRIHINQLESYRLAVSKFKSTETSNIKCYLFYLRSGNSVEI